MLQELLQQPVNPLERNAPREISPELEAKLLARAKGPFGPAMTGDELMDWVRHLAK